MAPTSMMRYWMTLLTIACFQKTKRNPRLRMKINGLKVVSNLGGRFKNASSRIRVFADSECDCQTRTMPNRSSALRFHRSLTWITSAAFKPRFQLAERDFVRCSRDEINGQIEHAFVLDHFCFSDLF